MSTGLIIIAIFFLLNNLSNIVFKSLNYRLSWFSNIFTFVLLGAMISQGELDTYLNSNSVFFDVDIQKSLIILLVIFVISSLFSIKPDKKMGKFRILVSCFYFVAGTLCILSEDLVYFLFSTLLLLLVEQIEIFIEVKNKKKVVRDIVLFHLFKCFFLCLTVIFLFLATNQLTLNIETVISNEYYIFYLSCFVPLIFVFLETPPFHSLLYKKIENISVGAFINQLLVSKLILVIMLLQVAKISLANLPVQYLEFFNGMFITLVIGVALFTIVKSFRVSSKLSFVNSLFTLNILFYFFSVLMTDDFEFIRSIYIVGILYCFCVTYLKYVVIDQKIKITKGVDSFLRFGFLISFLTVLGFPLFKIFNMKVSLLLKSGESTQIVPMAVLVILNFILIPNGVNILSDLFRQKNHEIDDNSSLILEKAFLIIFCIFSLSINFFPLDYIM